MARDYRYFPLYPPRQIPRYIGKQLAAVWFDEFGPSVAHGQDWPATKEEESRMKQIDFAKPLRGAADKKPVTVVQEGLTLVRHSVWHSLVDEQGRTHAIMMDEDNCVRLPGSNSGIENVPEPKSDHLHLYRREGEEWRIDFGSGQLFTKEQAEANSRVWARHSGAKNTVVVKVPV